MEFLTDPKAFVAVAALGILVISRMGACRGLFTVVTAFAALWLAIGLFGDRAATFFQADFGPFGGSPVLVLFLATIAGFALCLLNEFVLKDTLRARRLRAASSHKVAPVASEAQPPMQPIIVVVMAGPSFVEGGHSPVSSVREPASALVPATLQQTGHLPARSDAPIAATPLSPDTRSRAVVAADAAIHGLFRGTLREQSAASLPNPNWPPVWP